MKVGLENFQSKRDIQNLQLRASVHYKLSFCFFITLTKNVLCKNLKDFEVWIWNKFRTQYKDNILIPDFHSIENITLPSNRQRPSLLPNVAWNPWIDVRRRDDIKALNLSFPFGLMPDFMTKKIIQSYNAAISYTDELIGQILQNIDENTIVAFIGDHGNLQKRN